MIEERETLLMELHHIGAELVSSGGYTRSPMQDHNGRCFLQT